MKRITSLALALGLLFSALPISSASANSSNFSDINGSWAESVINKWNKQGYIKGYANGTFKPTKSITRAEFVSWFNQFHGLTQSGTAQFADVNPNDWYYQAVSIAVNAGYVGGYTDGKFHPNSPITRQEVAAILTRYLNLNSDSTQTSQYTDKAKIADWAQGSVEAVIASKIMAGYKDKTFKPTFNLTRSEALKVLDLSLVFKVDGNVPGGTTNGTNTGSGTTGNNQSSTATNKTGLLIDKDGTYGPKNGYDVINGDVIITASNVTLNNTKINGNLIITNSNPNAVINLNNVIVYGEVRVQSPGKINATRSDLSKTTLTGGITLNILDGTKVNSIYINGSASLNAPSKLYSEVGLIFITSAVNGQTVNLSGYFGRIEVSGTSNNINFLSGNIRALTIVSGAVNNTFNLASGTIVDNLTVNAAAKFIGKGQIKYGLVTVANVTFEVEPIKYENTYLGIPKTGSSGTVNQVPADDTTVNSSYLVSKVTEAWDLYKVSVEGAAVGQYPTGSKSTLLVAINRGQNLLLTRSRTQAQVNNEITALTSAMSTFRSKLNQTSNLATLQAKVNEAKQLHSYALEGTEFGNYEPGAKIKLQQAIDVASSFIVTDIIRTQAEIQAQVTTLTTAMTEFESKKVGKGDIATLTALVAESRTLYDNALEGIYTGHYTPGSKSTFLVSLYKAEGVLANSATRSQSDIDSAIATLTRAKAEFENSRVVYSDINVVNTEIYKYQPDVSIASTPAGTDVTGQILQLKPGLVVDDSATVKVLRVNHQDGYASAKYLKVVGDQVVVAETNNSGLPVKETVTFRVYKNLTEKTFTVTVTLN
ncbi:S-layer homology domain-containing protein [Paenibacillus pabuli]|uniref:S-layer homology domain-containing protein n=1 Tax=Paenibacillus pabuli TaxID=1472 RepID=UPI003241DC72